MVAHSWAAGRFRLLDLDLEEEDFDLRLVEVPSASPSSSSSMSMVRAAVSWCRGDRGGLVELAVAL